LQQIKTGVSRSVKKNTLICQFLVQSKVIVQCKVNEHKAALEEVA